ncbi:MAG: TetR/AcrR family transcriptional regulator C-terminal domain-containing protein [Alphaproteobacteria bacterium]|nr:TetR/AcrR family transcriptional regulator C-terminal domain-containing protein [Alphaproteobacteria bacterium]
MADANPKAKSRRGDLTPRHVADAALACLDRVGLEAFSLREVARDLGVFPTAIYWHVPGGRNGLLAEVAARVIDGITPQLDPTIAWTDWLMDLFRRYRAAIGRHPNAAPLLGARLVSNAGVQADLVEGVVWALERAGYSGPALADAYNAVIAGMVGFVTLEFARAPDDDTAAWRAAQHAHVAMLTDGRYPAIARHSEALSGRAFILRWEDGVSRPLDTGFERFATALINGLRHPSE